MALIDDRGRLFGRVNVIDAAVGAMVVAVIPLLYASYALFRQPQPTILAVEPRTVTPTTTTVRITGENLRPFLRVSFNQIQGTTFALLSPSTAEVKVPDLPSGQYDVILYDVAREVSRLAGAITVEAAPLPSARASMLVAGAFVALDDASVTEVRKGAELTASGGNRLTLMDLGPARGDTRWVQTTDVVVEVPLSTGRQIPALLKAMCTIADRRCQVGGVDLEPANTLSLFTQGGRPLRFVVGEAVPDGPTVTADLRVRVITQADAEPLARTGDRERGSQILGTRLATLTSIGASRSVSSDTMWRSTIPGVNGDWTWTAPDRAAIADATVTLTLDSTSEGLRYRGRSIRVGAPFLFETDRYVLKGWILRVNVHGAANETGR